MTAGQILFVTRKFPPSVGGMELLSALVDGALRRRRPTSSIVLGRRQRHLVWFLPWAAAGTAWRLARGGVEWVVCGDALVLVALWPILGLRRPKVAVVVHGLDLVLPNRLYRSLLMRALRRADRVIANSASTEREAAAMGVEPSRLAIIHPGLPVTAIGDRTAARDLILTRFGVPLSAFLVVTVGRLVRRKGVRWFVGEVVPRLPAHVRYLVAGTGPEVEPIRTAMTAAGVAARVSLLGEVSEPVRDALLDGADAFVVPNIAVPGDIEGFGLVAVEAAMRGAPVLASRLEGLEDAVVDGITGWLCPPGEAEAFAGRLRWLMAQEPTDREATADRFRVEAERRFSASRMEDDLAAVLGLT